MGAACKTIDDTKESKSLSQTFQLGDLMLLRIAIVSEIPLLALEINLQAATLKIPV